VSDVVTGEAVVVEVRVAGMPSRCLALMIDILAQGAILLGFAFVAANVPAFADSALSAMLALLFVVLTLVGYPVIFETLTRGKSLGKLALGLRVVSDDGGPERFRQALFRALASVVEIWITSGAVAFIASLVSERGKRLGDVFAGTLVISDRAPRTGDTLITMPPQLASWARRLELSRLPAEVAGTARQYLIRWHDLAPAVREEMGARIAAQTASYVSPPPPPGVPPHAYLSAVLAERRRREEERLARQAADARGAVPTAVSYASGAPYAPGTLGPGVPVPGRSAGPRAAGAAHRPSHAPDAEQPRGSGGFAPPA